MAVEAKHIWQLQNDTLDVCLEGHGPIWVLCLLRFTCDAVLPLESIDRTLLAVKRVGLRNISLMKSTNSVLLTNNLFEYCTCTL